MTDMPQQPPRESPERLRPGDGRTVQPARMPKQRPDPRPMRLALGMAGLAALSALATAVIAPPAPTVAEGTATTAADAADPLAPASVHVRHVTRYVQLQPGQTAPPSSKVLATPKPVPTPAPKAVVKTRQSGTP
jgi:hypothetical protein